MLELTDRIALVTGASQGIGAIIARQLATQGARVILAARNLERLQAEAEIIRQAGGDAQTLVLDLAEPEALEDSLGSLDDGWRDIDILVNNAGVTADALLVRMTLNQWEHVLRVNLTGAFAMSRLVARGMMKRRWGRIISISSVVGLMGNPGQANYAAAKAGLIGFSKSLARELASRGITVNVIAPGYVETAMTERLSEAAREKLQNAIPMDRLGKAEDIAAAVGFLASEEAGYVTGEVLNVSGGLYI
jgi:3-oxoacyl-[acyl-carrier protein] reductase